MREELRAQGHPASRLQSWDANPRLQIRAFDTITIHKVSPGKAG